MSKTEQVANLRKSRASHAEGGATPGRKARSASAKKAKAKPSSARKASVRPSKEVRRGSKLETIVKLLTREGGCTAKEVLAATDWPAVSMPQQARAAGIKLRKEKRDGVTHYSAA